MNKKEKSIQKKLMQVILMTCGAVLLLMSVIFFVYEFIAVKNMTKAELSTIGQIVAANSTAALAFEDKQDADEVLGALKAQKHIVAACLYKESGEVFATYPRDLAASSFPNTIQEGDFVHKGDHMEGFLPVIQNDKKLGTLYLKLDMKGAYERFGIFGILALAVFSISFLLAYLLSKRLQQSISTPVLELAQAARIISKQRDYSVRVAERSNDEIGTLTEAFNHMLTEIEAQNAEIKALNASLEEKVKIRTNELQNTNYLLRQQNEFIETIIDSSVDLIAVFNKDLEYVMINRQADHIYPLTKEQMIGKNILAIFPSLKDSMMVKNLRKAFTGEFVHHDAYRSLLSDQVFENFFIPLKDKDGNTDRVLVIGHNITNIMKANEKLKLLNSELEKSNRDLEQFAYVASHDLQEPLRKIQTFSDLCERNSSNPDLSKKYMQKINSSAKRMSELIKAVLNYSRLSKSGQEFEPVDLNMIVQQVKTDLELVIEEKKAVIETGQLPIINGIPLQLSQLFLNLISNSLKFSNTIPVVSISTSFVNYADVQSQVPEKRADKYLQLRFSDNGIGFDQTYADRIFSIFQRLHANSEYDGTGIGLALCKKIVENHRGAIAVKSDPGKGTTFYIYLPLIIDAAGQQKEEVSLSTQTLL